MLNITKMGKELQEYYVWQQTPTPFYTEDYVKIVVQGLKKLYVDRNHPEEYDYTLYITDTDGTLYYNYEFSILQEEYIFILCKLRFMRMIMTDVSGDGAVSYTTNALSVTGAKEAYKSVQQEITDLEQERRIVFHKMMAHEEG